MAEIYHRGKRSHVDVIVANETNQKLMRVHHVQHSGVAYGSVRPPRNMFVRSMKHFPKTNICYYLDVSCWPHVLTKKTQQKNKSSVRHTNQSLMESRMKCTRWLRYLSYPDCSRSVRSGVRDLEARGRPDTELCSHRHGQPLFSISAV